MRNFDHNPTHHSIPTICEFMINYIIFKGIQVQPVMNEVTLWVKENNTIQNCGESRPASIYCDPSMNKRIRSDTA